MTMCEIVTVWNYRIIVNVQEVMKIICNIE